MYLSTEFGKFELSYVSGAYELRISNASNSILIASIQISQSRYDVNQIAQSLSLIYLDILKIESKYQIFKDIPSNIPFKDAVLRSSLENSGESLDVRRIMSTIDDGLSFSTYPETANIYDISEISSFFRFKTPFGIFNIQGNNLCLGSTQIAFLNCYPFSDSSENNTMGLIMLSVEPIKQKVNSLIKEKTEQIGRKFIPSVEYVFGQDKLRRAIRLKGMM